MQPKAHADVELAVFTGLKNLVNYNFLVRY
jgi:hypothetical protein